MEWYFPGNAHSAPAISGIPFRTTSCETLSAHNNALLPYAVNFFRNDWINENKFQAKDISCNLNLRGVSENCQWAISPVSISPHPVVRHSILDWARATHWWQTYRVSRQRRCLFYMLTHWRTAPRSANTQPRLGSEWTRVILRSRQVAKPREWLFRGEYIWEIS